MTGRTWRQILDYGRIRLRKTKHPNVQDSNDASTSFSEFSPTHPTSRFLLSPQLTIIPWLLRWLNTVWRAVSGNTRDGACFKLDKQTCRRKSNGTQNWFIKNFVIFGTIFSFIVFQIMRTLKWKLNRRILTHLMIITLQLYYWLSKTRLLKFGQISFKW